MSTNINELSVTIDSNPILYKPILFTTYDKVTKYNLQITYEDSTTKTIELVQNDKERPYQFVFKKEGKIITATGVPTVHEITENSSFCDFVNQLMDSNDLLIELDCSTEYDCTKVRFYLKDVRDIVDINAPVEDSEDHVEPYSIILNNKTCDEKIYCKINKETSTIELRSQVLKLGNPLISVKDWSGFGMIVDYESILSTLNNAEIDTEILHIPITEDSINQEMCITVRYYIHEINHAIFDEFIVIPIEEDEILQEGGEDANQPTLTRAVTTQDTQYLGDGLKPALGIGLTPGYKEYRNKKNYNDSVLDSAT